MARSCPVCPSQPLNVVQASDVEVDVCPRCDGMYFDRGELERFPDRPSLKPLVNAAKQAASRCRKGGHLIPRARALCATCDGEPVGCPGCGARLALVNARVCNVDLCTHCGGTWLDAGKFEALENATVTAPKAAPVAKGWEVAPATDGGADPWKAPGATAALPPSDSPTGGLGVRSPLACVQCGIQVSVVHAHAFNGDLYCGEHRPKGAVSGASLPRSRDPSTLPSFDASDGVDLADLVIWLFRLLKR
ncbi:zf-TFIIB domain-containing protein [Corallococcus macrosporus]|uniref:Zf-TFIIB domain-containing protein n=1 Tax=Corallococcus macrosporus TaxID=35 RepID=A0ABS3DM79_9BACT|nr:zf-TFIIB domain-containing protein [Corallococcus macrosporus]MBN8232400.1 zf-TFIIB domain-containing protein [Corallococcus macrosporus]